MKNKKKINYEVVTQMYETYIEETYRPANSVNIFSTLSAAKKEAINYLKRNQDRFKIAISDMKALKSPHFKV
jgi:hypothetical protein